MLILMGKVANMVYIPPQMFSNECCDVIFPFKNVHSHENKNF